MMKRSKAAILGLATIFAACTLAGCKTESAITWQDDGVPYHQHPTQDWWNYQFVYHPNAQVYFEPYTETWYWFQNGDWCAGDQAPPWVELDPRIATVVKLQQSRPFMQHESVVAMHPSMRQLPPQYDQKLFVKQQQERQRQRQAHLRMVQALDTDAAP